jgi:hypothetical protein
MTMPCPPNPAPPAGTVRWPAGRSVSTDILAWARANLKYSLGTLVVANVGGEDVIARLETHYHPPGGPIQPWGCHRGCTIYAPTAPLDSSQYGVFPPTSGTTGSYPTDDWVLAGADWYNSTTDQEVPVEPPQKIAWGLVAFDMVVLAAIVAAFYYAPKIAAR